MLCKQYFNNLCSQITANLCGRVLRIFLCNHLILSFIIIDSCLSTVFLPLDTSPVLSIIYFLANLHVIENSEIFHCVDKKAKRCHHYSVVAICEHNPHMVCCNTVLNSKNCIIIDYVHTARGIWDHIGI